MRLWERKSPMRTEEGEDAREWSVIRRRGATWENSRKLNRGQGNNRHRAHRALNERLKGVREEMAVEILKMKR